LIKDVSYMYSTMINKKAILLISIGIGMMSLTYLALQDSLNRPSISQLPISSQTAVSIVIQQENLTQDKVNDFSTNYVYIKGDGKIYYSEISSNSIGRYLDTTEPTITTGNHFAWEVKNKETQRRYYVDHVTGEIIARSKF
jgi:hypothetical protein